ncbi:hypothetical protein [Flexivirga oryzae]|uniref:Uncharacterized protein n=1 Tax=Flexivirga oryzae TaxID=1794944 RepID=A0A839NA05_9MICO|nr:hypothetical protein [Flexivirga oryzae]MBB2894057.1 hypothetical protein [Flexivirga oryzae]
MSWISVSGTISGERDNPWRAYLIDPQPLSPGAAVMEIAEYVADDGTWSLMLCTNSRYEIVIRSTGHPWSPDRRVGSIVIDTGDTDVSDVEIPISMAAPNGTDDRPGPSRN